MEDSEKAKQEAAELVFRLKFGSSEAEAGRETQKTFARISKHAQPVAHAINSMEAVATSAAQRDVEWLERTIKPFEEKHTVTPATAREKTLFALCSLGTWERNGGLLVTKRSFSPEITNPIFDEAPDDVKHYLGLTRIHGLSNKGKKFVIRSDRFDKLAALTGFEWKLTVEDPKNDLPERSR